VFYPGCVAQNRAGSGYALAAPLRLFIAGSDDWTAPQPCIDLATRLSDAGEPVKITVYANAYHGFDGPAGRGPVHLDVPNGVSRGAGVTVASNPEARVDAYARLKAYLHAWLDR
jgi:dienelactone hydrolase